MRVPLPRLRHLSLAAGLTLIASLGAVAPAPPQSSDALNRNVRIHNQTGWSMSRLQVSSGGLWSSDLLGASNLTPGASVVVRIDDGQNGCRYFLRAQFDNGQTLQREGVNACQVADYYFTR